MLIIFLFYRMASADAVDDGRVFDGREHSDKAYHHLSSDQLIEPWCNLCYGGTRTKIEAAGFCQQCNTFLCTRCLKNHNMYFTRQNHFILQGIAMPKTQADTPVKYLDCDIHRGYVNDHFCMDHSEMICSRCIGEFHIICKQKLITDLCNDLNSGDIQELREVTETIKKTVTAVKNTVEQNKCTIEQQKSEMIKQAKEVRDKLIQEVEDACSCTISSIDNACDKKTSCLSSHMNRIISLDETLSEIKDIVAVDVSPQVFIQLQTVAATVHQTQKELINLEQQLSEVDLKFSTNPKISDFLSAIHPLGKVREKSSQLDIQMSTEEIVFPSLSRKANITKTWAGGFARNIMQIKAKKTRPLNVKMADDQQTCSISGMAVAGNLLLVADWKNQKVKVFSSDDQLMSSLVLPGKPYHICMTDDSSAAVTTTVVSADNSKLNVLDISSPGALFLESSVTLGYQATRLAPCGNNLALIKWTEPRSVKMITKTGAEVWSVLKDRSGRDLFKYPSAVATNTINDKQMVIVTDGGMETITLLDANRGVTIKIIAVQGKNPHGLTVDYAGNVYVCNRKSKDIRVWSADFSRSRILLSVTDRQPSFRDIAYYEESDQIFIWDFNRDKLDRFQLTETSSWLYI